VPGRIDRPHLLDWTNVGPGCKEHRAGFRPRAGAKIRTGPGKTRGSGQRGVAVYVQGQARRPGQRRSRAGGRITTRAAPTAAPAGGCAQIRRWASPAAAPRLTHPRRRYGSRPAWRCQRKRAPPSRISPRTYQPRRESLRAARAPPAAPSDFHYPSTREKLWDLSLSSSSVHYGSHPESRPTTPPPETH